METATTAFESAFPSGNVAYGELCDFYNKYHAQIPELEKNIYDLKFENGRLALLAGRHIAKIDAAEKIIKQAFIDKDFDQEVVSHIASALEIELTREYDVQVTVIFNGSVIAPLDFDLEEIESFLNPELLIDYRDGIEGSFDTEDINVDIRPMD